MEILGKWKVFSALTFDEDFNQVWKEAEAVLADPEIDEDDKQPFRFVYDFHDDGKLYMGMPLPEGVTQEEIDAAVAEGEITLSDDGLMIMESYNWKEEDGKIFYESHSHGEIFGEEVSPWTEILQEDDKLQFFTYKLIKA